VEILKHGAEENIWTLERGSVRHLKKGKGTEE
jgi:hypothetical protein